MHTSRRNFLVVTAGAALLTACKNDRDSGSVSGGSDGSTEGSTGDNSSAVPDPTVPPRFGIVQRFPSGNLFTPGEVRLPVSITDGQNLLPSGPATITGWIETLAGERVADVVAQRRNDGIPIAYWEVRAALDAAKVFTLHLEGDDGYGASFEVWEAENVSTPNLGEGLPPFDTPTVDDHRGVEPYCSLTPAPCPLHELTLAEALEQGKPVAYMVGTPAHCSTGTCAPGLEFLVEEHERLGDAVLMVHADVYADEAGTEIAPAVLALNVTYEPIIYLTDADGTVVDRLDGVWDRGELRERLDKLVG